MLVLTLYYPVFFLLIGLHLFFHKVSNILLLFMGYILIYITGIYKKYKDPFPASDLIDLLESSHH